jgi:hypothetical protein
MWEPRHSPPCGPPWLVTGIDLPITLSEPRVASSVTAMKLSVSRSFQIAQLVDLPLFMIYLLKELFSVWWAEKLLDLRFSQEWLCWCYIVSRSPISWRNICEPLLACITYPRWEYVLIEKMTTGRTVKRDVVTTFEVLSQISPGGWWKPLVMTTITLTKFWTRYLLNTIQPHYDLS